MPEAPPEAPKPGDEWYSLLGGLILSLIVLGALGWFSVMVICFAGDC